MQTVVLRPLFHRGQEVIAAEFPHNREIEFAIKKPKGAKRTQTHKAWYLPLSKENFRRMVEAVKLLATLDYSGLKRYLEKRKRVAATQVPPAETKKATAYKQPVIPSAITVAWKLSAENLAALNRFMEPLKLKAYSPPTLKTYRNEFIQLLQLLKKKCVEDLTPDDLRRYFVYCLTS